MNMPSQFPAKQYEVVPVQNNKIQADELEKLLNQQFVSGWKLHSIDLASGVVIFERK